MTTQFVVASQWSNGTRVYLAPQTRHSVRMGYSATPHIDQATRYSTERAAEDALVRRRLASDVDSHWHHAWIETHTTV
jgi:hypothetical protein